MLRKIINRQLTERLERASSSDNLRRNDIFEKDVHLIDAPGLICFGVLMFVVFLQFFTRYAMNDSLGWTEEVARFLLVILAFSGSITAVRKGSHIFLEFFYRYLSARFVKATALTAETLTIFFYSYMVYIGVQLAVITRQNMVSIPVPKATIYWIVAGSFLLMAFFSLWRMMRKARMSSKDILQEIETQSTKE
ncbi:TRAP transporter small permease [Grimontia kaedaensis]|uniref:TRAP transporter small permease protein n=1 Tax=Grimontia kaedaensis TaxID=2872157 RepID=A0ABY4WZA7_9GAMM|nr:TRAP transporter small permease [Grimontia kaedaensis]USH04338.1 TRAP transporter small permease [Grimontia kaedaensis]